MIHGLKNSGITILSGLKKLTSRSTATRLKATRDRGLRREIMKKMRKISIVVTVLVICAACLFLAIIIAMGPTQGKKIEKFANPQKALLVIDVQEDYTGTMAKPPFPYKDSGRLITTVNKLIDKAHKKNILVLYVKQEFNGFWGRLFSKMFAGGTAIKGTPGAEIDKRISIVSDNVFSKPKADAFSNPKLEAFLNSHQVNELYIVGLDAEYCVHLTAKGALNRGYNVSIITNSILLRAEKKWDDLLKKYIKEGIVLKSSHDFLKEA